MSASIASSERISPCVGDGRDAERASAAAEAPTSTVCGHGVLGAEHGRPGDDGPPVDLRGRRRDGGAEAFDVRGDLRELGDGQLWAIGQHDGAEHGVLELAHVAGPGVAGEQLERVLARCR